MDNMTLGDFRTVFTRKLWEQFVAGVNIDASSLPDFVFRSWCNCRDYGIDPRQPLEASILSSEEFKRVLGDYAELLEIVKPILDMLMFSTNDAKFIVMLISKEGVILDVIGDLASLSPQENHFNRPGVFCEGPFFSARATTLALQERKPISLCGSEHYLEVFHKSLCYAAPIFDHKGEVIAGVSLATSMNQYNKNTLSMLSIASENITAQLQRKHLYETRNYLSSMVYSICGSLPDGIISLGHNGLISYANQAGEDILGASSSELQGTQLADYLDPASLKEINQLVESNRRNVISISLKGKSESKWICRAQALSDADGKKVGMTLFLSSERQIVQGITQVGGNRAHYSLEDIRGESPELRQCIQLAKKIAGKATRVLITGESGTGKELFAQGIHNAGQRRAQPFVAISCASIPRDLIEAELFGYVAGSFTGANKTGAVGKFELANNGTLFLDEIGSLPMEAQGKILRALQQNEITRIGGKTPIPVNVNVISANNVSLNELVKLRTFREDLLYRLNSIEIQVPPLRDRTGDTEYLAKYFINTIAKNQGRKVKISSAWMDGILRHYWRGNVRELEHACETALILCDDGALTRRHLPQSVLVGQGEAVRSYVSSELDSMDENFRKWLIASVEESQGNISDIAKKNNIARSTLYRKAKQFDIDLGKYRLKG